MNEQVQLRTMQFAQNQQCRVTRIIFKHSSLLYTDMYTCSMCISKNTRQFVFHNVRVK